MNCTCATASFTVSPEPKGFVVLCQLAPGTRPSMTFLFVGSLFCLRLPPDPSSRKRPCLWLVVLHHSAPKLTSIWMAGSPTGDLHPISSRPCWAYTNRLERTMGVFGSVAKVTCSRPVGTLGGRNSKISELGADSAFGITA